MIVSLVEVEDREDLVSWAEQFELTHLVAGDYDWAVYETYNHTNSRPQYVVIDRDFVVRTVTSREDEAEMLIDELLDR